MPRKINRFKPKLGDLGFTLIELMIVITIIGLLSSMILLGLRRVQSLGRDTRRIADLQQIRTGLELYFNRYQQYPNPATGIWTQQSDPFPQELINAGLGIQSVPVDPLNRAPYVYQYGVDTSNLTGYVLKAVLENTGNSAVNTDIDGTVFGVNCGTAGASEVEYCVGSS
jgi:prepilin-type N-terminal cleavage/methylation domain-containing protein